LVTRSNRRLAAIPRAQRQSDHLNRRISTGRTHSAPTGSRNTRSAFFSDDLRPPARFANILRQAQVRFTCQVVSAENQDQDFLAEHFEWPVPVSRRAHAFRVEVRSFLGDQPSRTGGGERGTPTHQKQMVHSFEHSRQLFDVTAPSRKVGLPR
jgi:hypothetical protein